MKSTKLVKLALASTLCVSSITGYTTTIFAQEEPTMMEGEQPSGGGGANTQTFDYDGTYTATSTSNSKKESLEATEEGQNVVLAQDGNSVTVKNSTLTKSGDQSDGDTTNFYGTNSIALAVGEDSTMYISNSELSADSEGSNGIFATDGAKIYSYKNTISTTSDNSRGLDATYGGNIIASLMTISTKGSHSAGVATDRGGGNVYVSDSEISTEGQGSPILYSTGNIQVDGITGSSADSQLAAMEGYNTISITNSDLTSTMTDATASDPIANGVIIYQSTSGDAETSTGETATLKVTDSSLTSSIESGSMFYFTNTSASAYISNTKVKYDSTKANLITVEGNDANSWGTAGSNGADVTFVADSQKLKGDISVDTISSLDFYITNSSKYTGSTTITENSVNTDVKDSNITVNVDSSSKWVVTGDSTVSNLNVEKGAKIVDSDGNTVSIVVDGETVVEGDSQYTITVTGSYSTSFETPSVDVEEIDTSEFDEYFG